VAITDPANAASTGKIFTILLSIHFLYRHSSLTGQLQKKLWQIKLWEALLHLRIQSQLHQEFNRPLLNQRFQCYQIIQLPLNQLYKDLLLSLRSLLPLLGKPEMM
jgi:hypothetical protein